MRRRIASLVIAVLVVSSALPLAPIGTAAAASSDCTDVTMSEAMMGFIGVVGHAADCLTGGGDTVDEQLNATDARETKTELYGSLQSVQESARVANDTRANALSGTETIALMESKNAYIRALDNDSTEATARLRAHEANDDFYARMQYQTIQQWNVRATEYERAWTHAENTTNLSAADYFRVQFQPNGGDSIDDTDDWQFGNKTVTLANGTEVTARTVTAVATIAGTQQTATAGPFSNYPEFGSGPEQFKGVYVESPYAESNLEPFRYLNLQNGMTWATNERILAQRDSVDADINDFVNNTYSAWEAGQINSSDLVDPYLANREYSPEDGYQTWALRSLMSMGQASPENISEFGQMNVTDLSTNETHHGVLLSDGLPASGGFTVGNTYNAENLTGPQFVITGSDTVELNGQFRLDSATNASGGNVSTVGYDRVRYRTTNITEYRQQIEDLEVALAETEARQQRLRNSLNDGLGFGGLFGDSVSQTVALLVIAALLGAALLN